MNAGSHGTRRKPRPRGRAGCWAIWTVTGLAAVAGCGAGSDEPLLGAASLEQWDSARVQITQTSGDVLQLPLLWVIDTVPDLEIGTRDGEEVYQFTRIAHVEALPGGEIVVAEHRSLRLRWFDAQGAFVRSVGRRGEGPGEFMSVRMIPQFQSDSLVVFDAILRRLTSMSIDGQEIRTYSDAGSDRPLLGGRPMAAYAGQIAFLSGSSSCGSADGVCAGDASVVAVDPRAATADTLRTTTERHFRVTVSGMTSLFEIPFDPVVSAATDDRGLLLSFGEEFEILGFNSEGALERIMRIDERPAVVEPEDLEAEIRPFLQGSTDPGVVRGWFSRMEIRERTPAFRALQVDPLGWIWAELRSGSGSSPGAWAIFDPSGQARGTITLPRDFVLHAIGSDFVLGAHTDAVGVPYVHRYPLRRTGVTTR